MDQASLNGVEISVGVEVQYSSSTGGKTKDHPFFLPPSPLSMETWG